MKGSQKKIRKRYLHIKLNHQILLSFQQNFFWGKYIIKNCILKINERFEFKRIGREKRYSPNSIIKKTKYDRKKYFISIITKTEKIFLIYKYRVYLN